MKPVVKVTGEFWAQTTEGDGNFHMFEFLEREGAQVLVEPIATWVAYLMYQAKAQRQGASGRSRARIAARNGTKCRSISPIRWSLRKKLAGIAVGETLWYHFYHRVIDNLGGITHHLVPQPELARLAHPFYNQFARGGEGHLEVGKNVYYTVNHLCHMVLALKPFGCMPSSQSDGVQSAVINKFKDMIFLPIETSGEGEVNAHSRVQMALGEAKVKAKLEFEEALKSTGKRLDDIKGYIAEHPELRRPFYHVPHRPGIAGTAAQFILHVSDRMDSSSRFWRRSRVQGGVAVPKRRLAACRVGTRRLRTARRSRFDPTVFRSGRSGGERQCIGHDRETSFHGWTGCRFDDGKGDCASTPPPTKSSGRITSGTKPSSPKRRSSFCAASKSEVGVNAHNTRMFVTGSGGGVLADLIGAKFVQEVTAVALAVEKLHPEVYSVIELGGQDAKIIVFKDDNESGRKKKIPSMNDKCAGGTGAVIDKINAKLKIPAEELGDQGYHGIKLHKVAGKCGVFAETDINGLQKVGTPPDQLMASLFDAIVLQNLSVLTRGHTLRPHVLLLGGPEHASSAGCARRGRPTSRACGKSARWKFPAGAKPEELIKVPQNAQYFAALGAIEFGKDEDDCVGCYRGYDKLVHYIDFGRQEEKAKAGGSGLVKSDDELDHFPRAVPPQEIHPRHFPEGADGRRLRRHRRRVDFHQGRAAR